MQPAVAQAFTAHKPANALLEFERSAIPLGGFQPFDARLVRRAAVGADPSTDNTLTDLFIPVAPIGLKNTLTHRERERTWGFRRTRRRE